MSTDNLTADRLTQLLSSCRERATSLIQSHIQGEGAVGTIYEELERWYDRYREGNLPMPRYQDLPSPVKDQLFDAWIEGVEGYFAKRAAESDSAACAASSPSQPLHATESVKASPEGSVCEVEPLGEVKTTGRGFQYVQFKDRDESLCVLQQSSVFDDEHAETPGMTAVRMACDDGALHLSRSHVAPLCSHLTAWLETGSFKLVPRAVSQSPDQSSLLKEAETSIRSLLRMIGTVVPPGIHVEEWMGVKRRSLRTLTDLNTALGEEQKGGAGV